MNILRQAVKDYLSLRRSLGFTLLEAGKGLLDFVTFMERHHASYITSALALAWAQQPVGVQPAHWARRLSFVRGFARHHSATDQRTEIPPYGLLPFRSKRAPPYLYSDGEIRSLLRATLDMPCCYKFGKLRPWTYHSLFGLLSVSGLRLGEARNLELQDVDLKMALLTIRDSKFGKSRLVPLHASTCEVLADYIARRERHWEGRPVSSYLFVSSQGNRLDGGDIHRTFYALSRQIGLRGVSDHHGPRLHDMRHRFATNTLVTWYRSNQDPERLLPILSAHTKRAYVAAFNQFFALVAETGRPVCRALLMEYRAQLIDQGLSASTINVRLSAIRKLVCEARDNNLLDPVEAARILTAPGVPTRGVRLGNWLTPEEAKRLLAVPDRSSLIGKRAFAILSVLVYCALRREELSRLEMRHIQKREGRWVIADLVGKRGRVRTVPIPGAAKVALDEWLAAASIESGFLFRQLLRSGRVRTAPIGAWTVWKTVVTAAKAAGIGHLGPHDLRRSCAKFCRKAGGDIEQVQELLGHEDISTTVLYLGTKQEIRQAVNDRIAL
jgi:integrase/recombinase XerD